MMSLISLLRVLFSLADLVHDVLDLVAQGLVLPPDLIQLEDGLLVGGLDTEQLRGGIAGLLLGVVEVHANAVNLLLPLANNSVELLGLLLHRAVEDLGLVELLAHALELGLKLALGPLDLGKLSVELLGGGLGLREPSLHLELGHLELLSLGDSLLLVSELHHLGLGVSLAHLSVDILLGADLLIVVVPHASNLMLGVPVLAHEALSLLGLVVSDSAGLGQLVSQGDLQLGEHVGGVLKLLQLTEKVGVLSSQLPLVSLHVSKSQVG